MRLSLIIPWLLLSLTGCMTQHDRSVWNEFTAIFSDSNDSPAAEAPAPAAKSVEENASQAAVPDDSAE